MTARPSAGLAAMAGMLSVAALPLVWLMPQHYLPWLTAQQEFVALALVAGGCLALNPAWALPRGWALALALMLGSLLLQWGLGLIVFSGDAWMVLLYLWAFAASIALGAALARSPIDLQGWQALDLLALATVSAALLSVAVALMQWTATAGLPLPSAALLAGQRPYANLAQQNHFCSVCFLGLAAAGWLCERRLLALVVWRLAAAMLVLGMALSGSRTGGLQLILACLAMLALRRTRLPALLSWRHAVGLLGVFAATWLLLPALSETLQLSGGRSLAGRSAPDARWLLWRAALDAVARQPLTGYGWHQVQSAMFAVALDHASLQRYFEYSHNLLLDLALSAGVPLALAVAGLAGLALWRQARAVPTAGAAWLAIGIGGLLVHSMVEYPLAYAYFLLPAGLWLGALHGLAPAAREWRAPVRLGRALGLALCALLLAIAWDYVRLEDHYRTLRLEATFGSRRLETPPPDLHLLTQFSAYLRFIHSQARPGMSAAELRDFNQVARRFVHPPVLLRLALASALNGRPAEARDALLRLCAMHTPERCDEGRQSWRALQLQHPQLPAFPAP